jgi:hypothetical protein
MPFRPRLNPPPEEHALIVLTGITLAYVAIMIYLPFLIGAP